MTIARTKEEIDRLVAFAEEKGWEGPQVFFEGKVRPLSYWKDCMYEEFDKLGLLIFDLNSEWDQREARIRTWFRWYSPEPANVFIDYYSYDTET